MYAKKKRINKKHDRMLSKYITVINRFALLLKVESAMVGEKQKLVFKDSAKQKVASVKVKERQCNNRQK